MGRQLRVVVADDEPSIREMVRTWLVQLGHEVTAVEDGRALVQACCAARPDLVVSDLRMPHLDGLTAVETVHRCGPIPTVLMSGSWEPEQARRAAALGAARLDKPFLPLELVAAVEVACPPPVVRRVLVVDDDADTVDSLALLFELYGCQVRTARDGETATAAAAAFRPHLMLVDVGMPRWGGLDAVRRIRMTAGGRAVRVVAHTGWTHDDARARAREAGCDEYLVKPVASDVLRRLIGAPSDGDGTPCSERCVVAVAAG